MAINPTKIALTRTITPKVQFLTGGGEADSPQHCDNCQVFLENELTTEGYNFVKGMIGRYIHNKQEGNLDTLKEWIDFYDIALRDLL